MNASKNKRNLILFIAFAVALPSFGGWIYQVFMAKNILVGQDNKVLIIPKETTWEELVPVLKKGGYVSDLMSFAFVAKVLDYQEDVKSGRYVLASNMNNLQAVRMLRSGRQTAVKVTFNSIRLKHQLAGRITRKLEIDSLDLLEVLNDPKQVAKYGFDTTSIVAMFLPNTYEIYWNTSIEGLMKRMKKEYDRFWNEKRLKQAEKMGLTPFQVAILASIVESETAKKTEAPRIAGVYLNRLNRNQKLEADPTVKFAMGDFAKKRILYEDLEYDSPYNTYKYSGLPPGLIYLPSIPYIDAVLNPEKHDFIFFCAKEDFSGFHNFAVTYAEHEQNSARYQRALNAQKIYK